MANHQITLAKEKCIGCNLCVKDCPASNITLSDDKAHIIANNCIMCGHCVAICPNEAISISGYETEPSAQLPHTVLNPDEVLSVIRSRRTIRQFENKKIPQDVIEQILEAGRFTHTAKNLQDVSYIVLDQEKERLERYAIDFFRKIKPVAGLFSSLVRRIDIGEHFFFFKAPIVIVIVAENTINGTLAAQNMEFVAEANGLGVLFSGFFAMAANASPKLKKALAIPKGKKVITTLVLGYPKVKYQRPAPRKKLDVKYM